MNAYKRALRQYAYAHPKRVGNPLAPTYIQKRALLLNVLQERDKKERMEKEHESAMLDIQGTSGFSVGMFLSFVYSVFSNNLL